MEAPSRETETEKALREENLKIKMEIDVLRAEAMKHSKSI